MDVILGPVVDVHVDQHRARRRMGHGQAGLFEALADRRPIGCLTGFDVPAWLHPPMEPPVAVEHHAAPADHDGRRGEVGRVAGLAEGLIQATQLRLHDGHRERLPSIDCPVGPEDRSEPFDPVHLGRRIGCQGDRIRRTCDAGGGYGAARARWSHPRFPRAPDWPGHARGRTLERHTGHRWPWPRRPPHRRPGKKHLDRCPGRLRACARWHSWERHFLVTVGITGRTAR